MGSYQSTLKNFRTLLPGFDLDFWAEELGSLKRQQGSVARITAQRQSSASAVELTLKTNGNFSGFRAGQHINLSADVEGRRVTRSYSICSAANHNSGGQSFKLTVKLEPNGQLSSWLHSPKALGAVVHISPAFGEFHQALSKATESSSPLLLLAAGSGITPMLSIVHSLAEQGMPIAVTLLYWERGDGNFCDKATLDTLEEQYPNFQWSPLNTEHSARINAEQLAQLAPQHQQAVVLACGSFGFVKTAQGLCQQSQLFASEAFSAPAPVPTTQAEAYYQVRLSNSGRSLEVSNQQSLLEALEEASIKVQSGCRQGICNSCSCQLSEGSVSNSRSGQIDHADIPVRLCVSRAEQNITLNL